MHVELAVDALISSNKSTRSYRGVRVTVISTTSSQPPMIADELRRQADVFTDLLELQSNLARDPPKG